VWESRVTMFDICVCMNPEGHHDDQGCTEKSQQRSFCLGISILTSSE
jgi:hypothetical protein